MGVWIETSNNFVKLLISEVTPHVGVWIETNVHYRQALLPWSLPTWECGLKPIGQSDSNQNRFVTPHVGVWIETNACKVSG